jgi:drug/metabolite transporter (DMT)-like permease
MARPIPLGILCAFLAACIYGTVPVSTRFGINHGLAAIEMISARTLAVAVALVGLAVLRSESFAVPRRLWPAFLLQCAATFAVSSSYLMSVQYIPVGLAVIVFFTFPALVALTAPLLEGRRPNMIKTLMSLMAFAGLLIAVGPEFGRSNALGLGLAAIAAIGCALQFISGRRLGSEMAPAAFGGLTHVVILPFVILLAFVLEDTPFQAVTDSGYKISAIAAVALGYLCGYFLHMTSVTLSRPSAVVPYFNIEPVVSTLLALAILGESLTINQMIGGLIVLVAIVLTSTLGERKEVS